MLGCFVMFTNFPFFLLVVDNNHTAETVVAVGVAGRDHQNDDDQRDKNDTEDDCVKLNHVEFEFELSCVELGVGREQSVNIYCKIRRKAAYLYVTRLILALVCLHVIFFPPPVFACFFTFCWCQSTRLSVVVFCFVA